MFVLFKTLTFVIIYIFLILRKIMSHQSLFLDSKIKQWRNEAFRRTSENLPDIKRVQILKGFSMNIISIFLPEFSYQAIFII